MKFDIVSKTIYVWLPQKLFDKLKECIKEREEAGTKPKLQLAQAAYLLNLPIYQRNRRKDRFEDGWVPIYSQYYKNISHFSKYMEFLVENKLLERHSKNYSTETGDCFRYRVPYQYYKYLVRLIDVKGHQTFVNKRNEQIEERCLVADRKTDHLTKWLDPEKFVIDYQDAIKFIRREYRKSGDMEKKHKRMMAIEMLDKGVWTYSRDGKDNRLHSVLTNLPKDIRKFVKYENEPLAAIDIRNSQPYILSMILQSLSNPSNSTLDLYLSSINIVPTMFDDIMKTQNLQDIQRFIDQVVWGEFYEQYGEVLESECLLFRNVCGRYKFEGREFEDRRSATKYLVMLILFCSKEYKHRIILVFKKTYPNVYKIIQRIKGIKEEEKNYFPILLQNIEADCILDYCSKMLVDEYPAMPLFTIHDSIVTTIRNLELIKTKFEGYLKDYFGVAPELKDEYWMDINGNAA